MVGGRGRRTGGAGGGLKSFPARQQTKRRRRMMVSSHATQTGNNSRKSMRAGTTNMRNVTCASKNSHYIHPMAVRRKNSSLIRHQTTARRWPDATLDVVDTAPWP